MTLLIWKFVEPLRFLYFISHCALFSLHLDMAPFYDELCKELNWKTDHALLKKMKAANEAELKKLDEAIEDAEKNLGESEIRESMLKKAEYLCQIGDKVGENSLF